MQTAMLPVVARPVRHLHSLLMAGEVGSPPVTLGHLHIPKTAGTSLNAAIAESLGVREVYFHRVEDRNADDVTLRLPSTGPARELVLCYPYFSGHMSLGQLQALNRTHIFSILTDPRKRLIKQFGWVSHAGLTHGSTILEWLRASFPCDPDFASPALHLIQNGPRPHDLLNRSSRRDRRREQQWIPCRVEHFERLAKSLITIATESPQNALDYLKDRELISSVVNVPHLNARAEGLAENSVPQELDLPPVEAVIDQLSLCTSTEYQFLHYLEESQQHYFDLQPAQDESVAALLLARGLAR